MCIQNSMSCNKIQYQFAESKIPYISLIVIVLYSKALIEQHHSVEEKNKTRREFTESSSLFLSREQTLNFF